MEKGLYKRVSDSEVLFAQTKISTPIYTITVIDYQDYVEEIEDGWYWFNYRQDALDFLNIIEDNEEPIIHPWHDEKCSIQIILTYEQNLTLLSNAPEFGVYIKENNINTIIENGFVYIYVNYILDGHVEVLKHYGAKINYI